MFFQTQRALPFQTQRALPFQTQRALPFQTRIHPQAQPQARPRPRILSSRGGETPKAELPMRFIINAPPSAGSCSACGH
jgi:hypothetical protein